MPEKGFAPAYLSNPGQTAAATLAIVIDSGLEFDALYAEGSAQEWSFVTTNRRLITVTVRWKDL